jgi:hypothetical protein
VIPPPATSRCCTSEASDSNDTEPHPVAPLPDHDYQELPCDGGQTPVQFSGSSTQVCFPAESPDPIITTQPETSLPVNEHPPDLLRDRRLAKIPIHLSFV